MASPVNGETTCFVCSYTFNYTGTLGSNGEINTPFVMADSVVATGNILTTEGRKTELEIIVECPECNIRNKVNNLIPSR